MRRPGERRWLRVCLLVGAACVPPTLSGCAALQEANRDWNEVMQSTANLLDPSNVGAVSPRAVDIDRRLQVQQ
jgi:hypothetical protein